MNKARTSLLLVAVVGIAVISVTTSVCVAENLVVNEGFEVSEDTDGQWPSSYGDWHGDYSSIIGQSSGIVPLEGSQMFQLKGTSWTTRASSATSCEVPQIVDVSQFKDVIAAGGAIASGSAYFNRVAGDAQTDTLLYITIYAYEGAPSSYPYQRAHGIYLDRAAGEIYSDSDPATWERCEAELLLPAHTDFVTIQVTASENVYNDTYYTEFDGHFADEVSLEIEQVILVGLEIIGPGEVAENFSASYKAIAYYDNNSTRDVTDSALWAVEPNTAANIDENGVLTTKDIVREQAATILASYTEGDITVEAEKAIDILAICPTGTALQFDGVDDYVDCGNDASLNVGDGSYTLAAWIKTALSPLSPRGAILAKMRDGGSYQGYDIKINPDGTIWPHLISSWSSDAIRVHGSTAINDGSWHHVIVTYDGSNSASGFSIYIDGKPETLTITHDSLSGSTLSDTNFTIGSRGGGEYLNGKIDEVAIYNRALSAEEIVTNMHTKASGDEPNLVGYWDFDEGSGQIAYDLSGNGNDGQLGSTPEADSSDPTWVDSDAPIGICSLYQIATMAAECALERKAAMLEELLATLAEEWTAYEALEELLESGDYGDLDKGDIITAKQKIYSATQHQEQAIDALEKSISKLEDALSALDYESEPPVSNQQPNVNIMDP